MGRLQAKPREELTERQKELYDRIAGQRGAVRGPFNAWLYSPELCDRVEALGKFVRYDASFPLILRELAVLVIARHWTSQYVWNAHSKIARKEGIDDAVIDAIAKRTPPPFPTDDQRIVFNFTSELLSTGKVSDKAYREAVELIDEMGVVELVAFIGNFSMVAMAVNTFEVDLPEGAVPQLS